MKDLGSASGTYLRVKKRLKLELGQIIEIGSHQYRIADTRVKRKGFQQYESLVTLKNVESEESFVVHSGEIIGRNNVTFKNLKNDTHLSGNHCQIIMQEKLIFLEDLNSMNGVWLRLSPANQKSSQHPLKNRDVL